MAARVLLLWAPGAPRSHGRPPKLTPTQKAELPPSSTQGQSQPVSRACWRSPMIQQMIYDRFGVLYNVFYLAQLLKNLGLAIKKQPSSLPIS